MKKMATGKTLTRNTENYCRLAILTAKGCTEILRTLVLHQIKLSTPAGHVWSVDDFLLHEITQENKRKLSDKQYRTLFPPGGGSTDIKQWDLSLLAIILLDVCQNVDCIVKMDVIKMKDIRNKICHSGDAFIEDAKFTTYFDQLKICIKRCLVSLGRDDLKTEMDALVQNVENSSISADESIHILKEWFDSDKRIEEQFVRIEHDLQTIKSTTGSTNEDVHEILSMVKELIQRHPNSSSIAIPDTPLDMDVKNCAAEGERKVSGMLVDILKSKSEYDPKLKKYVSEPEFEQVLEAVNEIKDTILSSNREITDAKEKCVIIFIHCPNFDSFKELVYQSLSGHINALFKPVEKAIRRMEGYEEVSLETTIPDEAFWKNMETIVENILAAYGYNQDYLRSKPTDTTRPESDGLLDVIQDAEIQHPDGTHVGTRIRINVKPRSMDHYAHIVDSFTSGSNKMKDTLENLARAVKEYYHLKDLSIEAKLAEPKKRGIDAELAEQECSIEAKLAETNVPSVDANLSELKHFNKDAGIPDPKTANIETSIAELKHLSLEANITELKTSNIDTNIAKPKQLSMEAKPDEPNYHTPEQDAVLRAHVLSTYHSEKEESYVNILPQPGFPTVTPPRELKLENCGKSAMVLRWLKSRILDSEGKEIHKELLCYRVYVNDKPKAVITGTKLKALIEGLDPTLTYKIYVKGVSHLGESNRSDIVMADLSKGARSRFSSSDGNSTDDSGHESPRSSKRRPHSRKDALETTTTKSHPSESNQKVSMPERPSSKMQVDAECIMAVLKRHNRIRSKDFQNKPADNTMKHLNPHEMPSNPVQVIPRKLSSQVLESQGFNGDSRSKNDHVEDSQQDLSSVFKKSPDTTIPSASGGIVAKLLQKLQNFSRNQEESISTRSVRRRFGQEDELKHKVSGDCDTREVPTGRVSVPSDSTSGAYSDDSQHVKRQPESTHRRVDDKGFSHLEESKSSNIVSAAALFKGARSRSSGNCSNRTDDSGSESTGNERSKRSPLLYKKSRRTRQNKSIRSACHESSKHESSQKGSTLERPPSKMQVDAEGIMAVPKSNKSIRRKYHRNKTSEDTMNELKPHETPSKPVQIPRKLSSQESQGFNVDSRSKNDHVEDSQQNQASTFKTLLDTYYSSANFETSATASRTLQNRSMIPISTKNVKRWSSQGYDELQRKVSGDCDTSEMLTGRVSVPSDS